MIDIKAAGQFLGTPQVRTPLTASQHSAVLHTTLLCHTPLSAAHHLLPHTTLLCCTPLAAVPYTTDWLRESATDWLLQCGVVATPQLSTASQLALELDLHNAARPTKPKIEVPCVP